MSEKIQRHVIYAKRSKIQTKVWRTSYGKIMIFLWKCVCGVAQIGPYTLKGKDGTVMDFMCLIMIDPASGWFNIIEIPNASVIFMQKGLVRAI